MTAQHWDPTASLPKTLMPLSAFAPFVEGLDHPEGVACSPDGSLYAGGEAGQIYRVSLEGTFEEIANIGGFALGLCFDGNGAIYACENSTHVVKRIGPDGSVSVYSEGAPNRRLTTPNYPVFDTGGNLYVSDSGDWNGYNGCIFRIRPGGATEVFTDEVVSFPNGMAMHPSGSHLYAVVSQECAVVRVEILSDGRAGSIETVVELPHNTPDGLAFDELGNLYVSCYTPDVIYRVDPAGQLQVLAADWERVVLAAPTNLAFCGPDRKRLVVGSLGRWHLSAADMVIPGAKLNYPIF